MNPFSTLTALFKACEAYFVLRLAKVQVDMLYEARDRRAAIETETIEVAKRLDREKADPGVARDILSVRNDLLREQVSTVKTLERRFEKSVSMA